MIQNILLSILSLIKNNHLCREKQNQKKNQPDSDSDSQNDSDKSQSSEEPKKGTRGAGKTRRRRMASARQKKTTKKDSGTTSDESQQSDEAEKTPTIIKLGTRQTKIEDFSAKSSFTKDKEQSSTAETESSKSLVNGAAKNSLKVKRTTKSENKSSDGNAKHATNTRKRQLSAEDNSQAAKQTRLSGSVDRDSQKSTSDDSPSKLSSPASTRIARSVHLGLRDTK